MKIRKLTFPFSIFIFNFLFIPTIIAGVPKDNADHLLFGGGFSLGTTLCELTVFKDISLNRALEYRDGYMSEWNNPEAIRDYQLVGTGLNLGITILVEKNDSKYSSCKEIMLK